MKTNLHLLSMPMHDPLNPSCQLGYLHSYVRRAFGDTVSVRSYSAFLDVLFDLHGEAMTEFYTKYRLFGEEFFFLVCCLRASHAPGEFDRALDLYNDYQAPELRLSRETIGAMARSLEAYLDAKVLPALRDDGLHIV